MSIDINAFRAIANQNPNKLVYVQGQSLKTTRNEAHHGAHTYRAATNAFLKACTDHYGSRMGAAIVKFLLTDIEGGNIVFRCDKALGRQIRERLQSAAGLKPGVAFQYDRRHKTQTLTVPKALAGEFFAQFTEGYVQRVTHPDEYAARNAH